MGGLIVQMGGLIVLGGLIVHVDGRAYRACTTGGMRRA
jgi:hypothetical protein